MLCKLSVLIFSLCLACCAGAVEEPDFDQLVKMANAGDVEAMFNLAGLYKDGVAGPDDSAKAYEWYAKAAKAGHVKAMTSLGMLYDSGEGVEQDHDKAFTWWKKAANAGDPDGMLLLGSQYSVGPPLDLQKAILWWEKAAELGNSYSMVSLGCLYENENEGAPELHDPVKMFTWWERAARHGEATYMRRVGELYEKGTGTAQNDAKAYVWYSIAALFDVRDAEHLRDAVAGRLAAGDLEIAKAEVVALEEEIKQAIAKHLAADHAPSRILKPEDKVKASPVPVKPSLTDAELEQNELARINVLIASKKDPNLVEGDALPPIFAATNAGQLKVVTLLLDHGASVDSRLASGLPLLTLAAYNGQEAIVNLLLLRGASFKPTATSNVASALHFAALGGSLGVVRTLLDRGIEIDARSSENDTPLFWAAQNGHLEIIKLLLLRGADINAVNKNGATALHYAARFDQPECIDLLIDRGLAVDVRDSKQRTPLHETAVAERSAYTKLVIEEDGKDPVTQDLTKTKADKRHQPDLSTVSQVITISEKNSDNPEGAVVTKTWELSVYENLASAKCLIERGADINALDGSGMSPLALTPEIPDVHKYPHELVAALLRNHGAK